MNKKNKDKRQERMEDLLYVPPIVLAKYILDLEDTIDEAIELLENQDYLDKIDCYHHPEEVIKILKGSIKDE